MKFEDDDNIGSGANGADELSTTLLCVVNKNAAFQGGDGGTADKTAPLLSLIRGSGGGDGSTFEALEGRGGGGGGFKLKLVFCKVSGAESAFLENPLGGDEAHVSSSLVEGEDRNFTFEPTLNPLGEVMVGVDGALLCLNRGYVTCIELFEEPLLVGIHLSTAFGFAFFP